MKLQYKVLMQLSDVAIQAAFESGNAIQAYAGKTLNVQSKSSGSTLSSQVVTEADIASQNIILNLLQPTIDRFDLGLLAEESRDDGSRFDKDYFWCVDPLDGTLPFLESRPGYAVSIALVSRAGESVIGVVYDPLTQTLYHAVHGVGAFRNHIAWTLQAVESSEIKNINCGGAVMNACRVLEQSPAIFYKKPKPEKGGGCLWDYAATACIYREIGAWVSDYSGKPLDLNSKNSLFMNHCGVIFATNADLISHTT